MAIFSKKETNENEEAVTADIPVTTETESETAEPVMLDVAHSGIGNRGLIIPRISEKAGALAQFKKYVFTVLGGVNKSEVRKAVEKMYGVKVANVNMVTNQGKSRRYGRIMGKRSGFKKAIVTLTSDSKEINIVEPS